MVLNCRPVFGANTTGYISHSIHDSVFLVRWTVRTFRSDVHPPNGLPGILARQCQANELLDHLFLTTASSICRTIVGCSTIICVIY